MAERPRDVAPAGEEGFGGLLRAYRERGLLSQERLGRRSGLSPRAIRDLETGRVRRPRGASVRLLADALGLAGWERERFEEVARPLLAAGPLRAGPVASAPGGVAPCQLPPDVADFVGRTELVWRLRRLLARSPDEVAGEPDVGAVVVSAVAGKAGVGKSALGVHVAHQLAADFPDGLYATLRGAQPQPLDPGEVLAWFLRALGVDRAADLSGVEERAALYRSRLAGRRVLVVLDDAGSEAQVRPLLEPWTECGFPFIRGWALRAVGELHHAQGRHDEARAALREALRLFCELDMPAEEAATPRALAPLDGDSSHTHGTTHSSRTDAAPRPTT